MEIPQEGKYVCKLAGQLVIYEAQTGSLCAAVPCAMVESGFTFKHTCVLIKADGTLQTKTTDMLKTVFGWDGVDPFWLMDHSVEEGAMRAAEFEIVGGPETGEKGGQYFKSQWMNPLGGGMKTPAAANRQSVLAKYGSKFRAVAGVSQKAEDRGPKAGEDARTTTTASREACATNAGREARATAPSPPVPTAPPLAPPPGAPVATMDEAWAALNEANPGKEAGVVEKLWFDTIARLFPNKSNSDLKPHEWGKLKQEFKDEIPM